VALSVFSACKATGTDGDTPPVQPPEAEVVDKSSLASAISVAKTVKLGIYFADSAEGMAFGRKFVTETELAALDAMIAAAVDVNQRDVLQSEVNSARDALLQAIADFQAHIKTGTNTDMSLANPTELLKKIADANAANLRVSAVSPTTTSGAAWVSPAQKTTFGAAISSASAVAMNPLSTQKRADDETAALDTALNTFNAIAVLNVPKAIEFSYLTTTETDDTTTSITLTFSGNFDTWTEGVSEFSSADISLFDANTNINIDNYKSGILEKLNETGQYRQNIQNVTAERDIKVRVRKGGYVVGPNEEKSAKLLYAKPVNFLSAAGIAEDSEYPNKTTAIMLYFDSEIAGFGESFIMLQDVSGISKSNDLLHTNSGGVHSYKLGITHTDSGILKIIPNKGGYFISPASHTVNLNYSAAATFNSAIPNEVNGTTKSVTLSFSRDIDDLIDAGIFTITSASGSANAGTLTKRANSIGVYDLAISNVTAGTVSISITGSTTTFSPNNKTITLSKAATVRLNNATPVEGESGITESISLSFTDGTSSPVNIDGLSENDITLGISGINKGKLVNVGIGHYTLPVSGFSTGGGVNISVSKTGYEFENIPYEVALTYTNDVAFYLVSPIQTAGKTTSLRLYFSNDIEGLNEDSISLKNKTTNESLDAIKGELSQLSVGVYELALTGNAQTFQKELPITVTVSSSNTYIPVPERDAVLKYLYEIANPTEKDLMVKFGIKPTTATTHNYTDVTLAFNALHTYINDSENFSCETVNSSPGNVVHLGDFIDLASLYVVSDAGGAAINETSNTDLGVNGKLLRLIVVGINSFNRRSNKYTQYVDTPHVVFQFQNMPSLRRMNASRTSTTGYNGSEMSSYLTTKYLAGLKSAGVPEEWLFAPKRRIWTGYLVGSYIIDDLLWLPTDREIFNRNTGSNSSYETAENQAFLEYYEGGSKFKYKKNGSQDWYWLASPYDNSEHNLFCCVVAGTNGGYYADDATFGVVPAFAVK
jgi:hypothetical protein